jgi:5'-deoxynucleotidase YfbR-like HD superfamily hydrolase
MNIAEILKVLTDAVNAKSILKTGYVHGLGGINSAQCDSVAAHSHAVSWLTLALGHALLKEGYALDMTRLLTMVIVHDQGETNSGDPGATAQATYGDHCKLYSLERDGLQASVYGLPHAGFVMELYDEYRKYSSRESLVVHAADALEGLEKGLRHGHMRPRFVRGRLISTLMDNVRILRSREGEELAALGDHLSEILLSAAVGLFAAYEVAIDLRTTVEQSMAESDK